MKCRTRQPRPQSLRRRPRVGQPIGQFESLESRVVLTGTPTLIEINPFGDANPSDFVRVGETTFFVADDGVHGRELWRTDGTQQGTSLVKDLLEGSGGSNPQELTALQGALIFTADDGQHGRELWRSDGTAAGTVMVRDINPGEGYQYPYGVGPLNSSPRGLTEFQGKLYFAAETAQQGIELWMTDGTTAGTSLVRDIATGSFSNAYGTYPDSSLPANFVEANGTLFFAAWDDEHGQELWKTDGTTSGTVLVKDLFPGESTYDDGGYSYGPYPNSSEPTHLTQSGGLLFFVASDGQSGTELWRSDGTSNGTFLVKDLRPGSASGLVSEDKLVDVNGTLFFTADDGQTGIELWKSDGTPEGTTLVKDIDEGAFNGLEDPQMVNVDGTLYFAANDGFSGTELWKSDGTESGTVLVADIELTSDGSYPQQLTSVADRLFFAAFTGEAGIELWESDGTTAGTRLVDNLSPGLGNSSPEHLFDADGTLFYSAMDATIGRQLYALDTEASTTRIDAKLTIVVDGQAISIPAGIGRDGISNRLSVITTADSRGSLLIQSLDDSPLGTVTLSQFFETWRTKGGMAGNNPNAVLSATQLLTHDTNADKQIQMFVNGEVSTELGDHVIQDDDQIVLVFGSNPVVSLNTNFGSILIELYEQETPGTVANFLNYVNDGDYLNSFFHRSVEDFVIQAGGFRTNDSKFVDESQFTLVPTDPAIQNEPGISNLRGTIAMAKLGSDPNSATSQFFINLSDENVDLDLPQNNSFTVFGQILDMTAVDQIASLPIDRTNPPPFDELPLSSTRQLAVIESLDGLGRVSGQWYVDANGNGTRDAEEDGVPVFRVYADANNNGQLDEGEASTLPDDDGRYTLQVTAGTHAIRVEAIDGGVLSQPGDADHYTVTVGIGEIAENLDFGTAPLADPTDVALLADSDTGSSSSDQVTRLNNRSADTTLKFVVSGVNVGTEVRLFANGTLIGQATPTGDTVTVTTDGVTQLVDGIYAITAVQFLNGMQSEASPMLTLAVDSQSPAAFDSIADQLAQVGEPFTLDIQNADEGASDLTYSLVDAPAGMTIDQQGVVRWTPNIEQAMPHSFEVRLTDLAGNSAAVPINVTVLAAIPALPDEYDAIEDTVLNVDIADGVLTNDGDENEGPLTVTVVQQTQHGTLTLNADGSFQYTPAPNFFGTDQFIYQATDGSDVSNVAQVTIRVAAVDDPVDGVADEYDVTEDQPLMVSVGDGLLANDLNPDGDELQISIVTEPTHGQLELNDDGSFVYTPDANYAGSDSFEYRISDGIHTSDTTLVTLNVAAVDDPPVPGENDYDVTEDQALVVGVEAGVLHNASDVDSDQLTASVVSDPAHGSLQFNSDGSFTYTPDADFFGSDSFAYTVSDGTNVSSPVTVELRIEGVPDAPLARDDQFDVPNDGDPMLLDVLDNDSSEPDGEQLLEIASVGTTTSGGAVEIQNGQIAYTAPLGFVGTDSFTYTIRDADGLTHSATVTVEVFEAATNRVGGVVYIDTNQNGTRDAGEVGIPGVLLTLAGTDRLGQPVERSVFTSSSGSYEFTELPSGTYRISQTQPSAFRDGSERTSHANAVVAEDEISNIVLAGGQQVGGNDFGELHLHAAYSSIIWFFASAANTEQMLRETVAIGESLSGNDLLASQIRQLGDEPPQENQPPVATNDEYSVAENGRLAANVAQGPLRNDTDPDDDSLAIDIRQLPDHGMLTWQPNGRFEYQPDDGFVGVDRFTYVVSDGVLLSNEATVEIDVQSAPESNTDDAEAESDRDLAAIDQALSLEDDWTGGF